MRGWALASGIVAALALGCGERVPPRASPQADPPPLQRVAAEGEPRRQPLPSFRGHTLDGRSFAASSLLGRRALILFFNPAVPEADAAARAVQAIAPLRAEHNFALVGVALAGDLEALGAFTARRGFDFPVLDDASGEIARRVGLRSPAALLGVDPEGYVSFGLAGFEQADGDLAAAIEAQLRTALRLPPAPGGVEPRLGERPLAPDFRAERLDGAAPLELASLRGRPVVLIFFLHTCPHCHQALRFLREQVAGLPAASRPEVVGVSMSNRTLAVRETLREAKLDFLPVLLDEDHAVRRAYGVLAGVPDLFLIDAAGRVVARIQGWREDREPALLRMRLAILAGQKPPMLLHASGYSGSEFCAACHEREHETWLLTPHAAAFDTLVRHGAEARSDCVGCHVVGYEDRGGYTTHPPTLHLEDVGCESCHGRGGPHLSPGFVEAGSYEAACIACHDAKHSLGFEYARFLPQVSHAANAHLATLSLAEKSRLLRERGRPRSDLLPTSAAYVGSDACRECHAAEYSTWAASPHARAADSLATRAATGDPKCLPCHTTAYGRPGGFPEAGRIEQHADLARVGCESCHGPGGDHVGADAVRRGTIVSLTDKCDSCVILQICGSCHDEANDPGFEFAVLEKIEAQRHGGKQLPRARDGAGGDGASLDRGGTQDGVAGDGHG